MRLKSLWGVFLLFYFVNTEEVINESPSNTEQPQDTNFKTEPVILLVTKLSASPTWYLNVGDSVEISCTTIFDSGNYSQDVNLELLWTKIGPENETKTVVMTQKAATGISYILGPVTHEHQGIYTCDDDGSMPDLILIPWHIMIWVADDSPRATLDVVSHNRTQFLKTEMFTLGCQLPDTNTEWKMMRFDKWWGTITQCPNQELSNGRISCNGRHRFTPNQSMLYWCESPTGERSNAINITIAEVNAILESPPLPVLEGEDVTLHCLRQNSTTKMFDSNFLAIFSKNSQPISPWRHTHGAFTLKSVTIDDEGLYQCTNPMVATSQDVWISIKAHPDKDKKTKRGI